ncbi:hypothetical protein OnM2_036075 [Erysiphe neolycopersici]|uniref:Rrn9 domain-containing protein n=1 Tax=Erysiphe neolycopersici TaxID=212602 RepID=A0A420HXC7_9PEZI|nr:hypothetical protein OnM2_036075 [Erysiphe neolycopersici]
MSNTGSSFEESDSSPDNRPTRHSGSARKWHHITERERGEYTGLIRARNENLSLHLYNSHKLRQHAKEFENDPLNAKINFRYPNLPYDQRTFKPPNGWTAWPLSPDSVPRLNTNVFSYDKLDSYTIKKEEIEWPSQELEEVIQGIALKLARKKFESRQSQVEEKLTSENSCSECITDDDLDTETETEESLSIYSDESETQESSIKSQKVYPGPVFSTDDERSRKILRPSIRHILTKIDEALTSLHETRKICYNYSFLDKIENSKDYSLSQVDRPKETSQMLALPKESVQVSLATPVQDELPTVKKPRRGRPLKVYERLDGETDQELLVRIARKNKKAIPPSLKSSKPEKPDNAKNKSQLRNFKASPMDRFLDRRKRLGLRDWSEVLSIAALIGLPRDVILKTTQRCVNLFDESILIKTIIETHYKDKNSDSMVCFKPRENSCQSLSNVAPLIFNSKFHDDSSNAQKHNYKLKISLPKRNILAKQIFFCPINHCPRKILGFRDQHALFRHIELGHGIKRDFANDNMLPSPEDLDGAIHVDGFLRCVGLPYHRSKKNNEEQCGVENIPPVFGLTGDSSLVKDLPISVNSCNDMTSTANP